MKKILFVFIAVLFSGLTNAQNFTISGSVEDNDTGEKLISATIYAEGKTLGTVSNNYGFYSLTLAPGSYQIIYSYVGYQEKKIPVNLQKDTVIHVSMNPSLLLDEVVVSANKATTSVRRSQMSMTEISAKTIKKLPVLLGEVDVIKAIQLLPGVQSGTEGTSGFYVRGGGPDQNLILLDGVPVYNANHLFGFFSVFNADALSNVTLIKGGFPARYGGRLSSVLDIRMKEGNNKEFKGEGSVGLISSKLTLEGPLGNENTSFIVSGRRTYLDILAQPLLPLLRAGSDMDRLNAGYYFYDLNAKINHRFNDKHRLYLSYYMGRDRAYLKLNDSEPPDEFRNNAGLEWGNQTTALRWNYAISNKLFANTTLTYSNYTFVTGTELSEYYNDSLQWLFDFEYDSGIRDFGTKLDFDYLPSPNHYIKFGAGHTFHTFKPGISVFKMEESSYDMAIDTTFGNEDIPAREMSMYVEDDWRISALLKANIGMHYSGFWVNESFYNSFEPRASVRLLLSDKLSLKAAYSKMNQYIHLLTNTSIGLPTDLWLPATDKIKPQKAQQVAVGAMYALSDDIEVSLEGFYKKMDNLIEYKEGASFFSMQDDWQDKIVQGQGWSYGMEFLLKKNMGKTSGWIGYTLSWSERQFNEISFGERFPYRYDRRHDISVVLTHKFNDRIDMGLTWVYGTGNAVTLGLEEYTSVFGVNWGYFDGIEYYEGRNSYRLPAYHRLDLGINFRKETKWGKRTWSFGVYNAYNRKNPFFLQFEYRGGSRNDLVQYSLFPLIPSVSYSFSF